MFFRILGLFAFFVSISAQAENYLCSSVEDQHDWAIGIDFDNLRAGLFEGDTWEYVPLADSYQLKGNPLNSLYFFEGQSKKRPGTLLRIIFNDKYRSAVIVLKSALKTEYFKSGEPCEKAKNP